MNTHNYFENIALVEQVRVDKRIIQTTKHATKMYSNIGRGSRDRRHGRVSGCPYPIDFKRVCIFLYKIYIFRNINLQNIILCITHVHDVFIKQS